MIISRERDYLRVRRDMSCRAGTRGKLRTCERKGPERHPSPLIEAKAALFQLLRLDIPIQIRNPLLHFPCMSAAHTGK